MTTQALVKKIVPLLRANGIEYAALFGSVARGEATPKSDVDILVRFNRDISLLDHIGIAQDIEDVLQKKIDLIPEKNLKNHLAPRIKKDLQTLYGKSQRPDLQ